MCVNGTQQRLVRAQHAAFAPAPVIRRDALRQRLFFERSHAVGQQRGEPVGFARGFEALEAAVLSRAHRQFQPVAVFQTLRVREESRFHLLQPRRRDQPAHAQHHESQRNGAQSRQQKLLDSGVFHGGHLPRRRGRGVFAPSLVGGSFTARLAIAAICQQSRYAAGDDEGSLRWRVPPPRHKYRASHRRPTRAKAGKSGRGALRRLPPCAHRCLWLCSFTFRALRRATLDNCRSR